jgi:hypothetical protein
LIILPNNEESLQFFELNDWGRVALNILLLPLISNYAELKIALNYSQAGKGMVEVEIYVRRRFFQKTGF